MSSFKQSIWIHYKGEIMECAFNLKTQTILSLLHEISRVTQLPLSQIVIANLDESIWRNHGAFLDYYSDQLYFCKYSLKIARQVTLTRKLSYRKTVALTPPEEIPGEPQPGTSTESTEDIPVRSPAESSTEDESLQSASKKIRADTPFLVEEESQTSTEDTPFSVEEESLPSTSKKSEERTPLGSPVDFPMDSPSESQPSSGKERGDDTPSSEEESLPSTSKRFKESTPISSTVNPPAAPSVKRKRLFPERLNSKFDNKELYTKKKPGQFDLLALDYNEQKPARRNLVVLDIDKTIYDQNGKGKTQSRPGLKIFMEEVYKEYDIAIWSSTSGRAIMHKLVTLDILHKKKYRILFCLDTTANTKVLEHETGVEYRIKSLRTLWKCFPEYNEKNTLICDDLDEIIEENHLNGIRVEKYEHTNYDTDNILRHLKNYLLKISDSKDFSELDHSQWELKVGPPEEEEYTQKMKEKAKRGKRSSCFGIKHKRK